MEEIKGFQDLGLHAIALGHRMGHARGNRFKFCKEGRDPPGQGRTIQQVQKGAPVAEIGGGFH